MLPIRIFIGYDPREAVAYHVCQQSIIETAKNPERLEFHPVTGAQRDGSNTFIYERFLVPHHCGFNGYAIFIDGDMIVRSDIEELLMQPMYYEGVRVVKHDYRTKHPTKYLGHNNEDYPRKNWSSVIVWNCGFFPNRKLTPHFVAESTGSYLHRFSWLQDDQIGALDPSWNKLVLEQDMAEDDKIRHYTIGTPCFAEYAGSDPEWHQVYGRMIAPQIEESKVVPLRKTEAA